MTLNTPASIPRPWNRATRIIWVAFVAAALLAFVISEANAVDAPLADCASPQAPGCASNFLTLGDARVAQDLGFATSLFTWAWRLCSWIARLSLAFIGLLLFWRRPDDWVAWFMSLALVSTLVEGVVLPGHWQWLDSIVSGLGVLAWLPLIYVFPNGRVEPRWLRWVLVPVAPVLAIGFMVGQYPALLPPILQVVNLVVLLVFWVGLGGYSVIYRYRRVSGPVERQQTKWVIVGFFMLFITSTIYLVVAALYPPWQPSPARLAGLAVNGVTYAFGYPAFAVCLGISILRYRLWDIDLVIRRTLLYSTLTVTLGLIYFGGVVVLQQLFGGLMGGGSSAAIVATTLLIAALFQPLRRRLQNFIDRRFYRRKYDTAKALAAFGASARDNTDLDELTGRLQDVLDETMQPAHSAVWLKKPAVP